jgi:hypothetical protein
LQKGIRPVAVSHESLSIYVSRWLRRECGYLFAPYAPFWQPADQRQIAALSDAGSSMVAAEVTGDTGTVAVEAEDANQGNVILTLPTSALDRYLRIDLTDGAVTLMDIGLLGRSTAYGIREGRVMLDRRDRSPFTGAEFPVPAIINPRFVAFVLPALSLTEPRNQHRDLLRRLVAAGDRL